MHRYQGIQLAEPGPAEELRILGRDLGCSEPLAQVLWQRGHRDRVAARAYLRPSTDSLHDPFLFGDMEKAVERIEQALAEDELILIHGDYDADGLTGTVLLLRLLKLLGGRAQAHIPARSEGYSFGKESITRILKGGFGLCISVDNGTAAREEIATIQAGGCDVIVTDHHSSGPDPAKAFALLNPRQADSGYPFADLAGVGVAFKLAWALASRQRRRRSVETRLGDFLHEAAAYVALGSVADVVPLVGENRYLVRQGLDALVHASTPGLRGLMHLLGTSPTRLTARDIAFRLAPRLNAAGRMAHASLALDLLLAETTGEAEACARKLDQLNRRRQKTEAIVCAQAESRLERDPTLADKRVLCTWDQDWHLGVLGIVAARLAGYFEKPSLVLAIHGDEARGSGRSFQGIHLKDLLDRVEGVDMHYGGHAAAVGLHLAAKDLPALEAALQVAAAKGRAAPKPQPLLCEAEASLAHWSSSQLKRLSEFGPFGQGNAAPRFLAQPVRIGAGLHAQGPDNRDLAFTAIQDGCALPAQARGLGRHIEELRVRDRLWRMAYSPRFSARPELGAIEIEIHDFEPCRD